MAFQQWGDVARRQRKARFWSLTESFGDSPIRILDLGGIGAYWRYHNRTMHPNIRVTVLNLEPHPATCENIEIVVGDLLNFESWNRIPIDVIFSNSLLEHLGFWNNQERLALEIQKTGVPYFVQTPNRWFPIEPHFMFLGFHFLPRRLQLWLIQHYQLGYMPRIPDRGDASREVAQIRLLSPVEMKKLFPKATLWREKVFGLTKSFVAIGGDHWSK